MVSAETKENESQTPGKATPNIAQSILDTARSGVNVLELGGLTLGAGIVGKYIGIAPEISAILADTANNVPNAAEVSGVIPSLQDGLLNGLAGMTGLSDLPADMHNLTNIVLWLWLLSLIKLGLKAVGAQKGRVEAGVHATVWTALSYLFLKEFSEVVVSGQTLEIMNYISDEGYEALSQFLPDKLHEPLSSGEGRKLLYERTTGVLGVGTSLLALKNYYRLIKGRPTKK